MESSKLWRWRARRRRPAGFAIVALTFGLVSTMAQAASAEGTGWQSTECELDGSPLAATPYCTPPLEVPQPPATPLTCVGAVVCMGTYKDLAQAGFDITGMLAADRRGPAPGRPPVRPTTHPAAPLASVSYSAWLNFYLYAGSNCSGTVNANGRCGWLYHKYSTIVNGIPQPGVRISAYPARSGNNNPAQDWVRNVGPIPNEYSYKWGFMNGSFTGYEPSSSATFSPGKWRLDPWVVSNGSQTRSAFEIHGGTGSHAFAVSGTNGCIRLPSSSITSLKSMWNSRTSNKKNGAYLSIYY